MASSSFDLEEKRLANEVRKRRAKRVLIQLPEGLKPYASRLAEKAEKAGAQVFIAADPCYGACDLAIFDAQSISADLIIHYGHTRMIEQTTVPVVYFDAAAKLKVNVQEAVKKALPLLRSWRSIGLVTTVQHAQQLEKAKNLLILEHKTVAIGDAGRLRDAGQVIGCDYSNAKAIEGQVDAFLFIGGGRFHAIGVSLATSKPTIVADPYERRAYGVENEADKIRKQRMTSVSQAKKAATFGILVGLKLGQERLQRAIEIKERLESKGKKTVMFALREITPEALMQFPTVDVFVNTACPWLVLDDSPRFQKPILTANEALCVIEEIDWETLCKQGWFEN